jgi:beta-phosphoglucomutase-like phosphatase (HAD superfamily)
VLSAGVGPFELTLAGDEVTHAKPHPEPYLTAARRLGVEPAHCVVVEDSPSGVAAAEAAGAAVVAVPSVPGVLFDAGPRRLVADSLAGIGLADLRALVA